MASSGEKKKIQLFIDDFINPILESHGGFLAVQDFDLSTGTLKVIMGGGCHGCAASSLTMNTMILDAIKAEFPEVINIYDVTDHSSGENPFM